VLTRTSFIAWFYNNLKWCHQFPKLLFHYVIAIRVLALESQHKESDALPCMGVLVVTERMGSSKLFLLVGDMKSI